MSNTLFTIGHSTHSLDRLLELLAQHAITAVADVRSTPYSQHTPQFNRETLQAALTAQRMAYVFLGRELGARREETECYLEGKVQFDRVAQTSLFQQGLARLRKGMESFRIALLCSEKDPITCHRTILVCRHLRAGDLDTQHILEDGTLESGLAAEQRLMRLVKVPEADLFLSNEELIEMAYDRQSKRVAYVEHEEPQGNGADPSIYHRIHEEERT